jgi:hypothetical protein
MSVPLGVYQVTALHQRKHRQIDRIKHSWANDDGHCYPFTAVLETHNFAIRKAFKGMQDVRAKGLR